MPHITAIPAGAHVLAGGQLEYLGAQLWDFTIQFDGPEQPMLNAMIRNQAHQLRRHLEHRPSEAALYSDEDLGALIMYWALFRGILTEALEPELGDHYRRLVQLDPEVGAIVDELFKLATSVIFLNQERYGAGELGLLVYGNYGRYAIPAAEDLIVRNRAVMAGVPATAAVSAH